ncbi:MAG: cupin domain-containing protein [Pyrinomonadaceae bacterium]|nr:cupin domain-containing protein [Pyrinomonadaceae bacterium]
MVNKWLRITSLFVVLLSCVAVASKPAMAQESTGEQAISRTHKDPQLKWGPCPPIFPKGCEVTVLHGDPANGRSDVFLRTPANYRLPAHWHTSPEHMILVSGVLHVTYEGQKPSVLRAGSYAYGPAKVKHEARCANSGPCVLFIAFESPIDAVLVEGAPK